MQYTGERLIPDISQIGKHEHIYKEHIARYKFCLPYVKNKKVLDIACGTGYGTYMIASNQVKEARGGDLSKKAIEEANSRYTHDNLSFQTMDALNLPFADNHFDLVVSLETIEHISNYKKFVAEIFRVLKPGGKLILSTPNSVATQLLNIHNPYHLKEFTGSELSELLSTFFKRLELFGQRKFKNPKKPKKLLTKLPLTINRIPLLGVLRDRLPSSFRRRVGQCIDGLGNDFSIREIKDNQTYLYFLVVCQK